ncbi:PucR family transcriptional regulator [Desulfotomaculum copahuensis]|uniref:PucR C-terminal helix-turn-helix domain-containing protein n=1 Tax=Desulfotomaculum copahuensis TaxID=1838280 RepID=A0A1B7LAH2_9FIRM|nr:helix-turn-helix domain-containing protein [Desulfotomaculum copahuensis]OAT79323.1 hypothetical protein A6M21_16140 [Desulfotomaculum copahuensis]
MLLYQKTPPELVKRSNIINHPVLPDNPYQGNIYRQLVENLLADKGVRQIIEMLHKQFDQPVLLILPSGQVICFAGYKHSPRVIFPVSTNGREMYNTSEMERRPVKARVRIDDICYDCVATPIFRNKGNAAYLLLVLNLKYYGFQLFDLLQAVARVLAVKLERENLIFSVEQKYKIEYIINLLLNPEQTEENVQLVSRIWNRNLSQPHLVFLASTKPERIKVLPDILKSNLEQYLSNNYLYFIYGGQHIILVGMIDSDYKATLNAMKAIGKNIFISIKEEGKLIIACQSVLRSDYNLSKGYMEAKYAINIGLNANKNVFVEFDNLGLHTLIYSMYQESNMIHTLENYFLNKLGILISHDRAFKTDLYNTLIYFLENSCNYLLTAEKMFIHPNTLRYRLKKTEKILNIDLSKLECLVELVIAFKMDKIKKHFLDILREVPKCPI